MAIEPLRTYVGLRSAPTPEARAALALAEAVEAVLGETDEALLDLYYADGTQVGVPVGLDGVWRTTETEYGPLAARGAWYTGPVSFRFELREVGNNNRQLYNIRFDGQRAFVGWVHSASLMLDQLQATAREQ
mgnify:CR=1 FL=1